jgi:hypothetical protein
MFRLKKEKVTGNRRKLYTEELNNLTANSQIIKWGMRRLIHVAGMEEMRNKWRILVGNTEETIWKIQA